MNSKRGSAPSVQIKERMSRPLAVTSSGVSSKSGAHPETWGRVWVAGRTRSTSCGQEAVARRTRNVVLFLTSVLEEEGRLGKNPAVDASSFPRTRLDTFRTALVSFQRYGLGCRRQATGKASTQVSTTIRLIYTKEKLLGKQKLRCICPQSVP